MAMASEANMDDLLNDVRGWVSEAARKFDHIEKYDLKFYGTGDKTENYGSDILFVDLFAENVEGEKREYNFVIKYGKKDPHIREKIPVREVFEREIVIYDKIIPCYHKFAQDKNFPLFSSAPKCYLTKLTETEEVVVLENLKKAGYKLHDRNLSMNLDHIKLVLAAYAEWHALSFAIKDQKYEEIVEITRNWDNPLKEFVLSEGGIKMFNNGQQYLYEVLEEMGEMELLHRYKEKIGNKKARDVLLELLNKEEAQSVVLHADCWNNNFLFKYEDDELPKPRCTKVALLDFQISFVHSPVLDLFYFIYAAASSEELKHFKELLHYYYNHFANHLRALGSDPEKLFPFRDLIVHCQKYSAYGAMFVPNTLLFVLTDKEDVPDFGKDNGMDILKKVLQKKEYRNRVFSMAKHFVEYEYVAPF